MKNFTIDTMKKALSLMNIKNICTKDEIKNIFRRLCMVYHPDKGGSTEKMQMLNWAYKYIMANFESLNITFEFNSNNQNKVNLSEEGKQVLDKLILIDDIDVYIVGCWLWVSGNTKPHKETLKQLGLYWHTKKSMWAWAGSTTKSRGSLEFEKMCDVYGSSKHHRQANIKISSN